LAGSILKIWFKLYPWCCIQPFSAYINPYLAETID